MCVQILTPSLPSHGSNGRLKANGHDFEVQTLRHRIEVGRNQFSRLRKILTSRKHLALHRRARIWNACIWPSISYDLTCCGFTGHAISKLSEVVATQLRTIARSPRHITHETNQALRERLCISIFGRGSSMSSNDSQNTTLCVTLVFLHRWSVSTI